MAKAAKSQGNRLVELARKRNEAHREFERAGHPLSGVEFKKFAVALRALEREIKKVK